MSTINKEYISDLNIEEVKKLNSFRCINNNEQSIIVIMNSDFSKLVSKYCNKYFELKCNVELHIVNEYIGNYHIITCLSENPEIIKDFNRVCDNVFIKPNLSKSSLEITQLFYSLEVLFSTTSEKENRILQIGVYGELFTLKYLCDHKYDSIAQKWHSNFYLKHDLELDKNTKVEIKTTINDSRTHKFRHSQIYRPFQKVIVISNVLEEVQDGLSLYDLFMEASRIMIDSQQLIELELLMKKCEINESNKGIECDYKKTGDNLAVFEDINIPKYPCEEPDGITNTAYDICFLNVKKTDINIFDRYSK